jgi:hypothetical protein
MPDPEANGSQGNCGEEVPGELVVTGGDSPEKLELVEEALDQVALAIESEIDGSNDLHVALRGDVSGGSEGGEQLDDGAGAVAAVGDGVPCGPQAIDQGRQRGLVGRLAGRQDQPDRQAVKIDDGVDFCAQSATRTANGVIRAPFFPPAAC